MPKGSDEPISAARKSLHVPWLFRRISQCLSQLVNRRIQALFEIDERPALPQGILQIVAANYLPGLTYQQQKDLERFALEPDADSVLNQCSGELIVLERSES